MRKKPGIVLLGWFGAHPKHFNKYVKTYNSLGFNTVSYISPVTSVFRRKEVPETVFNQVEDLVRKEDSIVFHCFSGNGSYTFAGLLQSHYKKYGDHDTITSGSSAGWLNKTVGIINDSTPAELTINTMGDALSVVINNRIKSLLFKKKPASAVPKNLEDDFTQKSVKFLLRRYLQRNPTHREFAAKIIDTIISIPYPIPHLYLYGQLDPLAPHQLIRDFAQGQRELSYPVVDHCWSDTTHCDHFKKHPEQYFKIITQFIEHQCQSYSSSSYLTSNNSSSLTSTLAALGPQIQLFKNKSKSRILQF